MNSWKVLGSFLKKEFHQLTRSREMLAVLFVLPAIQLLVMGFAVTNEVKNVDISFFDYDNTALSRSLISSFSSTDRFRIDPVRASEHPEELIFRWKSKVVIVIPAGFARNCLSIRPTALQLISDGIDGNSAAIANAYVQSCLLRFSQSLLAGRDLSMLKTVKTPELITQMSFNRDLKSNLNVIPGIIAVLVTVSSMVLSAISLVKEKELGTLEQLMVTPVKKYQLLIGKLLPYLILSLLQLQVAMLMAGLLFKITLAGSYLCLMLFSLIYLFTTLGLGTFISTRVSSQQQAMFFSWFLMVVMILLSGFLVPVQNMPKGIRLISWLSPLTHYITVLREIVVKGSSLLQLKNELFTLLSSGIAVFGFSVLSFRKRVG